MAKQFGMFDVMNHILYGSVLSEENLNDFSLYMFNRWLSMRSVEDCQFVNDNFNNKHFASFNSTDKAALVSILKTLCPKKKMCKIHYIKNEEKAKAIKTSADDEKIANFLAETLAISLREAKSYIERETFRNSQEYKQLKKSIL